MDRNSRIPPLTLAQRINGWDGCTIWTAISAHEQYADLAIGIAHFQFPGSKRLPEAPGTPRSPQRLPEAPRGFEKPSEVPIPVDLLNNDNDNDNDNDNNNNNNCFLWFS